LTSRARWNVRDLGGLPLESGGTTAPGVLLRSANLQGLTADDIERLLELRVRVVVDLRTGEELRLEGDGPLVRDGRIELRHRSLYPEKGKLTDVMISRADGELPAVRYYLRYLRDRPDSIVGALSDIAAADGAVLVHCAAGKDRTGLVAAVVLSALGVEDETVAADYALTSGILPTLIERNRTRAVARGRPAEVHFDDYDDAVLTAEAVTMLSVLRRLRAEHSSVEGYLRAHGLSDEAVGSLRAGLLA
jgi:protein tyrosine/serine phosphatase